MAAHAELDGYIARTLQPVLSAMNDMALAHQQTSADLARLAGHGAGAARQRINSPPGLQLPDDPDKILASLDPCIQRVLTDFKRKYDKNIGVLQK